jgi:integrase
MRTERNRDASWNVWMTRDEYAEIPRHAHSDLAEVAIRLMGDCGLRVAEVLDVTPRNISRRSDGRSWKLEVVAGKDTSGEYDQGKHRETWLPRDLEARINRLVQDAVDDDEPVVDRSKRTVQNWVERACDRAADETGDDDYRRVSTHDLRRCWAHHLLVEERVSPRIVMALGGWDSYDAIEPYLAAPTEENINESMSSVEL